MDTRKKWPPREPRGGEFPLFAGENQNHAITTSPPYVRSSRTSREAARRIRPHSGRLERLVIEQLLAAGADGLTDPQLQERLHLSGDSQRPTRISLVAAGRVVDSGVRRPSPRGHPCIVWVAMAYRAAAGEPA